MQKSEKLEQVHPEQRALSKIIVEQHIDPILKYYHGKNLTDFKDVDFQVYFPLKTNMKMIHYCLRCKEDKNEGYFRFRKKQHYFQIYTARRNMLERQTLNRVLQPEYQVLPPHLYKLKNTKDEGNIIPFNIKLLNVTY